MESYGRIEGEGQMKNNMSKLQTEIEIARADLDYALEQGINIGDCYEKSVKLDLLIEKYIDLCEGNTSELGVSNDEA